MSRNISNKTPLQKTTMNKPFCSVCKTAGKTLEEYTNHYTKSSQEPDAIVTCPTILNGTCSYCKQKGHFKSNCIVLKEKEIKTNETKKFVGKESQTKPIRKTLESKTQPVIKTSNLFNILEEDYRRGVVEDEADTRNSGNDEGVERVEPEIIKEKTKKTEEFPALTVTKLKPKEQEQVKKMSYAETLSSLTPEFRVSVPTNKSKKETKDISISAPTATKSILQEDELLLMEEYPLLKLKYNSIKKCTTEPVKVITYADKLTISQVSQELKNIPFCRRGVVEDEADTLKSQTCRENDKGIERVFVKKDKKLNIKHSWSDDNYWNDDDDDDDDEDIDQLNEKRDLEAYNNDVYWYE